MITEKQLKIFQVLVKQPFAEFTRKQIKQTAKENSNNALAIAIKHFAKENIIKIQKVGKSELISLNLEEDKVYYYLALANAGQIDKPTQKTVAIVKSEVEKITHFYSLIIFGSFAVNKQKKTSDLDISIFIENKENKNKVMAALNSAGQKSLLPIDAHVITKDDFIEMLVNEEENLGKEIAKKHLVLHNHQLFYDLIKEGIKHGYHI